jgi:hypothetical protein
MVWALLVVYVVGNHRRGREGDRLELGEVQGGAQNSKLRRSGECHDATAWCSVIQGECADINVVLCFVCYSVLCAVLCCVLTCVLCAVCCSPGRSWSWPRVTW